jgi:hypothetical protein
MRLADKLSTGLLLGLLLPALALLVYALFMRGDSEVFAFIREQQRIRLLSPLISLAALLNLGLFFLLIQGNRYQLVKGIIAATLLWALLIVYLKFVL